ncbi:unnamed protein product [Effrenium voratum]|nr:unnamed protein product [Effrenium voratum]
MAQKWTCFDCDWDNDVSLSVCEMCDTARAVSCVARADREDAQTLSAKRQELDELQKLREAEQATKEAWLIQSNFARLELERRRLAAEQDRVRQERAQAEERQLKQAQAWAASRMAQLKRELREINGMAPSSRRSQLRALQLELHPDKQPEGRRLAAQPLFLLVQSEWEAEKEEPVRHPPQEDGAARRNEDAWEWEDDQGNQIELGTHWTLQEEDDEGTGIVALLSTGTFENAMEAFTSIQIARRSRGLDAERPGHSWKAKMDRFEAEAWRLYAVQQGQTGFQRFAIAEHLQKAIRLHPDRGELYLERAKSRMSMASAGSIPDKELQKVLDDCQAAISRDGSLGEAFDLAIRARLASLASASAPEPTLAEIADLASRGRRTAADADFVAWRRCAKAAHRGLRKAQDAITAKQHYRVERIIEAIKAVALPELQQALSAHLNLLQRQAETQREFQEAYATAAAGDDTWASAWGL